MSSTLEKISDNTAYINIEIEEAEFKEGIDKAFKKNAKHFAIPGFRKGKAPKKIIEQHYGESVFYEDAINILLPDVYDNAIAQLNLEPVDRPNFEIKQIGQEGENVLLSATVTLKPEVQLGKYKGIQLDKVEYTVTEEQVDEEIKSYQERNARIITVEDRAVKDGDIVTIDYTGYKDGVAFLGGEGKDFELTIGSGQFIPGFEEQLIGCEIGSDVKVNVTFPEDYHADDLKGAKAEFDVKIHGIKIKELPQLDDEFAKDVSEFDTFDAFRSDVKEKLVEAAQNKQKAELENKAIEAVAKETKVDIPQCMIDTQIDVMLRDYDMRLSQQGLNLDKYLEITNSSKDEMRKQLAAQAQQQVQTTLTLEQLVKQEQVEATEQEIEDEFAKIADMYKMDVEKIKKAIPTDDIKRDIATKKAIEFIVANAKIK
ncbi:MAG: trigger factor [Clostridiaceae bacterium]|nr:trigger factor [Clostridiaceae bacterium]